MANEKRLIDKEKLLERLTWLAKNEDQFRQSVICGVMHTIAVTPSVDAVEVVHGRWIAVPSSDMMTGKAYKCTSMNGMYRTVNADDFCSYGERRDDK